MCICVCVYIYIYIKRERERETERSCVTYPQAFPPVVIENATESP